jgi:hypothetical protein
MGSPETSAKVNCWDNPHNPFLDAIKKEGYRKDHTQIDRTDDSCGKDFCSLNPKQFDVGEEYTSIKDNCKSLEKLLSP